MTECNECGGALLDELIERDNQVYHIDCVPAPYEVRYYDNEESPEWDFTPSGYTVATRGAWGLLEDI